MTFREAICSKHKITCLSTIGFLFFHLGISDTYADLRVAPLALYLGDHNKTGRIIVENMSDTPKEIEINLRFGYPMSDDKGNVSVRFMDTVSSGEPSAASWVRVYPKRFSLAPHQQQTVRFAARPPAGLPEQEYWARALVTSHDEESNFDTLSKNISVHLGVIYRIGVAINFRHGEVATGILVGDISATRIDSNMEFKVSMQRQGNAAYLGNINLLLHDQNGRVVAEFKREIAVYRSLLRRYELNVSNLPKGNYTVELRLTTDREGNSPGEILQVNPVYRSLSVQLR